MGKPTDKTYSRALILSVSLFLLTVSFHSLFEDIKYWLKNDNNPTFVYENRNNAQKNIQSENIKPDEVFIGVYSNLRGNELELNNGATIRETITKTWFSDTTFPNKKFLLLTESSVLMERSSMLPRLGQSMKNKNYYKLITIQPSSTSQSLALATLEWAYNSHKNAKLFFFVGAPNLGFILPDKYAKSSTRNKKKVLPEKDLTVYDYSAVYLNQQNLKKQLQRISDEGVKFEKMVGGFVMDSGGSMEGENSGESFLDDAFYFIGREVLGRILKEYKIEGFEDSNESSNKIRGEITKNRENAENGKNGENSFDPANTNMPEHRFNISKFKNQNFETATSHASIIQSLLPKTVKPMNWNSEIVYSPAEYIFPEIFNPAIYKHYLNCSIYASNMDKTDKILYRPKNSGDLVSQTNTRDAIDALTHLHIASKNNGDLSVVTGRIREKIVEVSKREKVEKDVLTKKVRSNSNSELIIGIQSANRNLENRQAIRATYAANTKIAYKFLLDRSNPELEVENSVYNDIHFLNVEVCYSVDRLCSEAERNCRSRCNGFKLYHWMRHVAENFPKAKFIMKVDDDLYICPDKLHSKLTELSGKLDRVYYGWNKAAAFGRWTEKAKNHPEDFFVTEWHGETVYVQNFDEMFTCLSMDIVWDVISKPICSEANMTAVTTVKEQQCYPIKKSTLGGAVLGDMMKRSDKKMNVVIGNDEIISWQDHGDLSFDILKNNLCEEKVLIHRATPLEMRYIDWKRKL